MVATTQRLSISAQRRRWGYLSCAATPLLGAVLYSRGYHLPFACPIQYFMGMPCPLCGLTQSLIATVQGDLGLAFSYHWFGPVLVLGCMVTVVHMALELKTRRPISTFYTRAATTQLCWEALFGLLLTYHSCRLLGLVESAALVSLSS
jgi:hypothetical protein